MSEPRRRTGPVVLAGLVLLGLVAVLTAVGGPAAVASYRHAQKVAERFGETPDMAAWLPLTTDGMLVLALIVMYARRLRHEPVGRAPWVAFAAGTAATLAANLAAADLAHAPNRWEVGGRLAVAVWPPIAFALTLELLALLLPLVRGLLLSTAGPVHGEIPDRESIEQEMNVDLLTARRPTLLYRLMDDSGALLYVGVTSSLRVRLRSHRSTQPWWADVVTAVVETYEDRSEALAAERSAIASEGPRFNQQEGEGPDRPSGLGPPVPVGPAVAGPLSDVLDAIEPDRRRIARGSSPAGPTSVSDEEALRELREARRSGGPAPARNEIMRRFRVGAGRADRLLTQLQTEEPVR